MMQGGSRTPEAPSQRFESGIADASLRSEAYGHLTGDESDAATLELVRLLDPLRPCPICHSAGKDHLPDCACQRLKDILCRRGLL